MRFFMSRYGGQDLIIGKGKASVDLLPEDQSVENMIDHYATEIIPQHFVIASYDALPEWMGGMQKLNNSKVVKLGTLTHDFREILLQYELTVTSDIYVVPYYWSNVYAVILKTDAHDLKYFIDGFKKQYDFVLLVTIKSDDDQNDGNLFKNPGYIEKILWILFYKMGLTYEGDIKSFEPSKTYLGKKISQPFLDSVTTQLAGIETDEAFAQFLMNYEYKLK